MTCYLLCGLLVCFAEAEAAVVNRAPLVGCTVGDVIDLCHRQHGVYFTIECPGPEATTGWPYPAVMILQHPVNMENADLSISRAITLITNAVTTLFVVPATSSNVIHLVDRRAIRQPLGDVLGKRITVRFKGGERTHLSDTLKTFVPELRVATGGGYCGAGICESWDEMHVSSRDFSATNTPIRDCLMGAYPPQLPYTPSGMGAAQRVCPLMWIAEFFVRPGTNTVVRIEYRRRLLGLGP